MTFRSTLPYCLALLLAACHLKSSLPPLTVAADSTVDSVRTIRLSASPTAVALGADAGERIELHQLWSTDTIDHPVAATFLRDGRVLVADLATQRLVRFSPDGRIDSIYGREGEGPGEFARLFGPVAVASAGATVVALQGSKSNTLVGFPAGAVPLAKSDPVAGDWLGYLFRRPDLGIELPLQSGPELWARRLQPLDSIRAALLVAPGYSDALKGAKAVLRTLSGGLTLGDTLAEWPAPKMTQHANPDPRGDSLTSEEVWATRPLWASGEGQLLIGSTDQASIEIRSLGGSERVRLEWPSGRRPITEDDRTALGDWLEQNTRATMRGAEEAARQMSASERREAMRQFLAAYPFPVTSPELSSAWVLGRCVLLAGFDPQASPEGTARRWLVVDPSVTPARVGEFELANGERILGSAEDRLVTVRIREDGRRTVATRIVDACRKVSS